MRPDVNLHVVSVADTPAQPWRNGGGQTRELLAWPGAADWQLRVSVADIDRDGPFSSFDGMQRWFAVLQGAGVVLSLPPAETLLTTSSEPFEFAGEAAPGCRLVNGPTRDLNLMARRSQGRARMQAAIPGQPFPPGAAWRAIFTAEAIALQVGTAAPRQLPAMSLAWSADSSEDWRLADHADDHQADAKPAPRAWWLSLETQHMTNRR